MLIDAARMLEGVGLVWVRIILFEFDPVLSWSQPFEGEENQALVVFG
jgi:hypothetical protein